MPPAIHGWAGCGFATNEISHVGAQMLINRHHSSTCTAARAQQGSGQRFAKFFCSMYLVVPAGIFIIILSCSFFVVSFSSIQFFGNPHPSFGLFPFGGTHTKNVFLLCRCECWTAQQAGKKQRHTSPASPRLPVLLIPRD